MAKQSAYETRKRDEARLLGASRPDLASKMRAAAALKAGFVQRHEDCTETDWSARTYSAGPFRFSYDYQRADLVTTGPPPYGDLFSGPDVGRVIYTSGGMAGMTAILLALRQRNSALALPAGCYAETRELQEFLGSAKVSIPFIDSAAPFLRAPDQRHADVAVFDTSCFAPTSGSIRLWTAQLRHIAPVVVLVRSHHKLDMLGTEFGRLGSVLMLAEPRLREPVERAIRDAVRLIGAAAKPEDFPPFSGQDSFQRLTRARTANIISNTRQLRRTLAERAIENVAFRHGLYVDVVFAGERDRESMSKRAEDLAAALGGGRIRHAGSFGFDFTATEWTDHPLRHEVALRIAPGDQPRASFTQLARDIAARLAGKSTHNRS